MKKKKPCKICAKMAGYKKRRKSGRGRRRGMYGIGAVPVTQLLTMGAGALVAAKFADQLLNKIPVKMVQDNQKVKDGVKAALGVGLTYVKNEYAVNAGLGMAAYAIANLVSGFIPTAGDGTGTGVGMFGTGKYEIGTGPTFMGALGPQANYMQGIDRWDGIGTEPDMIAGDFSDNGGLSVV